MTTWLLLLSLVLASLGAAPTQGAVLAQDNPPGAPAGLTVGDRVRPLEVQGPPLFGWFPQDADGNELQTAYQINVWRVKDSSLIWDSGKIASSDQAYVIYGGPGLTPDESYAWTVRTWDRTDQVSPWADTAFFDMGIGDADWNGAAWIRRATTGNDFTEDWTLARKQYDVSGASPVVRARAYVAAMGQYELHINGQALYRGDSFTYPGEGYYQSTDITPYVTAGQPLAVGVLYHYWTCTCQGRANGPLGNTTLAANAAAGATNIRVASVVPFAVGDTVLVSPGALTEYRTVVAVGTAGSGGTGLTLNAPLTSAHPSGRAVYSANHGPSALLVRVVVDYADGSREIFISDGSWKVTKATQFTNATLTSRNGDAGDRVERYDARLEIPGWSTVGFDDSAWEAPAVIGPHPRPITNPLREEFTHLNPGEHRLSYETVYPVSIQTLADGTVVADFGKVISAMPGAHFGSGVAGRTININTSYRLVQATLAAPSSVGATNIRVSSVANYTGLVGAKIEIGSGAEKEIRTITSVGTAGAGGTGVNLDAPLGMPHASGTTVWGPKIGTATADTQGSNMRYFYTQKNGPQTAQAFTYWGWRYMQFDPPTGPGEPLDPGDIFAVIQHTDVNLGKPATFTSDNPTLDAVFDMMMRSAIYSSEEVFLDTPTREKGQFTGDTVDISFATMLAWGERDATQRAIREIIYSATHVWTAASSGYCTAGQVPCSFPSIGTPGRVNAVYPNGDNMRDIPDYTLMVPDWIMRYYLTTGDVSIVQETYPVMKMIADYVRTNTPAIGGAAGLVYQLTGGTSSYANGIIDWPAPMRYDYTFTNNGARTIHNAEAVGTYRAVAAAAELLGNGPDAALYNGFADELATNINSKLWRADVGRYSDGLSTTAGNPQIANTAMHAQTYPIYFGVAPQSEWVQLGNWIVSQGMRQGPMTLHKLLKALAIVDRPDGIVGLLTNPNQDGPAKILANDGTFMWEQWNPTGSESHSHGWGAWAMVDILETLLGIEVTSPGAATLAIAPPRTGLNYAEGTTWTQRGEVYARWQRTGDGVELDIDVPVNVQAVVSIPVVGSERYFGTGAGAPQFVAMENGRAIFTVGSGVTSFRPDGVAPLIDLVMPEEAVTQAVGAAGNYGLGSWQLASYTCSDDLSGVASCVGTVPDGSPFDTSTVGFHSFTVDAEDVAGNTASVTHWYNVVWDGYGGFMPPLAEGTVNRAKAGSTIPIKFRLGAYYGMDILRAGYPQSQQVDCATFAPLGDPAPTDSDAGLTWADDKYQYDWQTEKGWDGTCRQLVVTLQDNTVHTAVINFR